MTTRYGWWVTIAVMLVLGVRVVLAVQAAAVVNSGGSGDLGRIQVDPLLTAVDRQDSLLAASSSSARDPFRSGALAGSIEPSRTGAGPGPAVAEVVPPRVAVLMDTGSGVIMQIEVDGETSPRLPVGGSFRGWAIVEVSATTVTVVKDGASFAVPRP